MNEAQGLEPLSREELVRFALDGWKAYRDSAERSARDHEIMLRLAGAENRGERMTILLSEDGFQVVSREPLNPGKG